MCGVVGGGSIFVIMKETFLYTQLFQSLRQPGVTQDSPAKWKAEPECPWCYSHPVEELPTHRPSHSEHQDKYNIHASSFPTVLPSCWQDRGCNIRGAVVFFSSQHNINS